MTTTLALDDRSALLNYSSSREWSLHGILGANFNGTTTATNISGATVTLNFMGRPHILFSDSTYILTPAILHRHNSLRIWGYRPPESNTRWNHSSRDKLLTRRGGRCSVLSKLYGKCSAANSALPKQYTQPKLSYIGHDKLSAWRLFLSGPH